MLDWCVEMVDLGDFIGVHPSCGRALELFYAHEKGMKRLPEVLGPVGPVLRGAHVGQVDLA